MKIERVANMPHTNSVKSMELPSGQKRDFAKVIAIKQGSSNGVELPKQTSKEMIQNFAEWYFKQGKVYENTRSYKQAISAYEKSNSVAPDIAKSESIDSARLKAYKG